MPEWFPAVALALRVVAALGSPTGRPRHPDPGKHQPEGTRPGSLVRGGAHSHCRGLTSGSTEGLQWQLPGLHRRHSAFVENWSSPV